ncbi:MAG TPA: phenylalanine--tRNA ligase subunit beta [Solirubrobacteraceae bacterium]|nr:phenylalanine--tRNA ligase subunit beta [Solirubrobacteraceae bacterium]
MRVPVEWLYELCDPGLDVKALEERLTMTGTKVEAVHHHGVGALERFVVGRVLSAERHPDADRLSVCVVEVGEAEPAQIVCGAPNVAAGQTVAVARPGAVMPDGTKLKAAKLRGVVSDGMILAEDEVAIGTDHDGIMVLENGARPGTPLQDVLPIATAVLELEITPNRPDCLGVYGVARELHAATGAPLAPPPWAEDPGSAGAVEGAEIVVEAGDVNPRFTARVFEDVSIGPSPWWLKARLMAAGMRPINNVVDITNYVMLLAGHPLHAFDLDRVAGGRLVIRRARDGEQVQTLDGQVRTLDSEMLVIDDAEGPTSIAGVMGGARSEVQPDTARVLMEVASWDGPNIHRTSQRLALRSEASGRFEKGLAPEQAMEAQVLATRLMIDLCGARVAPGTIDAGPWSRSEHPAPVVRLRERRVEDLLGRAIARERQAEILRALEFGVSDADDGLDVAVPAFRRKDVSREADLVEEVARIDGLEKLPATLPKRRGAYGVLSREQRLRRRALDALIGRGAFEIVGWSFTNRVLPGRLRLPDGDPRAHPVVLENPMSEEHAVLRTTLLGSLLDAARHNQSRGNQDLRLVECGTVYLERPGEALPHEHRALGGLLTGRVAPPSWGTPQPPLADVFAAKALLGAALDAVRTPWGAQAAPQPFLHPGRSARVLVAGEDVGWFGELHPLVARAWDLEAASVFEVDLDRVLPHAVGEPHYADLTSFPALRQDIAVALAEDVPAARVLEVVRGAGGRLLADVRVFDLYRGEQVGEGRKSIALALTFRAGDRTLTDEDAEPLRAKIVAALASELGGELRG